MSQQIKFKIGDLVKHVRKGETWFPIPSDEHTGIVLEIKEEGELKGKDKYGNYYTEEQQNYWDGFVG